MNKTKQSVEIAQFCDPAEKQLIAPVELNKNTESRYDIRRCYAR